MGGGGGEGEEKDDDNDDDEEEGDDDDDGDDNKINGWKMMHVSLCHISRAVTERLWRLRRCQIRRDHEMNIHHYKL